MAMPPLLRLIAVMLGVILVMMTSILTFTRRAEPQPWITFAHDSNLYRVRPDGTHLLAITSGYHEEGSHAWSANGRRLAFSTYRNGGPEIFTLIGSTMQRLTFTQAGMNTSPSWSPDGEWLVFDSNQLGGWHIYQIRSDGRDLQMLTSGFDPDFSPDGQSIVFNDQQGMERRLYQMDLASGQRVMIGSEERYAADWSPDGEWIVYMAPSTDTFFGIFKSRADGSEAQLLQVFENGSLYFPVWSPDGAWIAFVGQIEQETRLYKMRADGSERQAITAITRNIWQPQWWPSVELPWRPALLFVLGFAMIGVFGKVQRWFTTMHI